MLTDVLAALYVESESLSNAIEEAQCRVLDELLTQSRVPLTLQGPEYRGESEQYSNPAIDELLSLIEAQAIVRSAAGSLTQAA